MSTHTLLPEKPFRWSLQREEQLGRLLEHTGQQELNPEYYQEMAHCCARLISYAGNRRLVFVGRSPESLFDYLSGVVMGTNWAERLTLFHFSMRFHNETELRKEYPQAIPAMRAYMRGLNLHPEGIATGRHPVAFIDLVYSGDTFCNLVTLLHNWCLEDGFDWPRVCDRIRLIGITVRTKTSPNTCRWHQANAWTRMLPAKAVKNVSVDWSFWSYLGDQQKKLTSSYHPGRWGDPDLTHPEHGKDRLEALSLALHLHRTGKTAACRREFSRLLAKMPAMKEPWFRQLVLDIKK